MSAESPYPILLLDGGLGTTLETHHQQIFTEKTPLWSSHLLISDPPTLVAAQRSDSSAGNGQLIELLESCQEHRNYPMAWFFVEAGADLLLSATYQASFEGFNRTKRIDDDTSSVKRRVNDERVRNVDGKKDRDEGHGEKQDGYAKEDAEKYMRSAISLADLAITSSSHKSQPSTPKIVLSLGPYGAVPIPSQEYTGIYPETHNTTAQLSAWHLERLRVFKDHAETWDKIEYIAFETVPRVDEILAVRETMAALSSSPQQDRKFWMSCVFPNSSGDASKEGWNKLPDDSTIKQAVAAMLGPYPDSKQLPIPWGIGINCTKMTHLSSLILEFEDAVESILRKPDSTNQSPQESPFLVIYPDNASGLCYNTTTHIWEPVSTATGESDRIMSWDESVFEVVKDVRERRKWKGVAVGGCCKTAPSDIQLLRKRIDEAAW